MSGRLWARFGRFTDGLSVGQALWGWGAFWAAVAGVSGWAASTIGWVWTQGWGVVFFAGVGTACAVMLVVSFGMVAWRFFRPLPAPSFVAQALPAAPATASPGNETGGVTMTLLEGRVSRAEGRHSTFVEQLQPVVVALRKDVDRALDAIRHNAKATREEGEARFGMIRKTAENALEQCRKRQDASELRLKAEIVAVDNRIQDKLATSGDFLHAQITKQEKALASLNARLHGFQRQVFDILRARDAEVELRKLDAEASELFGKLFRGDEREYPDAQSWQADYNDWKWRINKFWGITRSYSESVEQPFALTDADFDGKHCIPDKRLFLASDMRALYQIMLLVKARHMTFKENAFDLMDAKGELPRV